MPLKLKELAPECFNRVVAWNETARSTPPTQEQQEEYCNEEADETLKAIQENDLVEILDGVADMFVTGAYLEHLYPDSELLEDIQKSFEWACKTIGHDAALEVLMEVLDSNDSKFVDVSAKMYQDDPKKLETLITSEIERIKKQYGCKEVVCTQRNGKLVFTDENNKIRKPFTFVEPDISSVIRKYGVSLENL